MATKPIKLIPEKRPRGRPRKYLKSTAELAKRIPITDDLIEEALLKHHGIQKDAAAALQKAAGRTFTRQALHNRINLDPDRFRPIIAESLENIKDIAEGKIFAAIEAGDVVRAGWLLDRIARERGYGYQQAVTGADGDPLIPPGVMLGTPQVHIYIPDNGRNPHLTQIDGVKPNGHAADDQTAED